MGWFNYYGLIAVAVILIPNIVCAVWDKNAFVNRCQRKALLILEQIGRYGCMAFMIFNVPYTYFGFWFEGALAVYLSVACGLLALYLLGWIIFWGRRSMPKALWLSITPAVLFLFCGAMLSSIPLMLFAIVFAIGHITVSLQNAK